MISGGDVVARLGVSGVVVEKAETTRPADRRAAEASTREQSECIFLDLLPRFFMVERPTCYAVEL